MLGVVKGRGPAAPFYSIVDEYDGADVASTLRRIRVHAVDGP